MPYSPVPNTTFGIELEFSLTNSTEWQTLKTWLSDQGLSRRWELTTDGSVASFGSELHTKGGHTLSALLADYKIIGKHLSELEKQNVLTVDRTAGFHVHVGVVDWTVKDLNVFYDAMVNSLDQWLTFQPRSRWDNHFCQKNTSDNPYSQLQRGDRYYMVNMESLSKHGTVELRLFAGTIQYYKVEKTLQIIQAFIKNILTDKKSKSLLNAIDNKKLLKFIENRAKKCHRGHRPSSVVLAITEIESKLAPVSA